MKPTRIYPFMLGEVHEVVVFKWYTVVIPALSVPQWRGIQ